MVRLLWISVVVCGMALIVLAGALYHVNSASNQRDQRFDQANARAILVNCEEIERVKASLRRVFERLVTFNTEIQSPAADLRAALYRDFINDYFSPKPCPRKEQHE